MSQLHEQVRRLRAQGLKYREIEERTGVNRHRAWQICNREAYLKSNRESNQEYCFRNKQPAWKWFEDYEKGRLV